MNQHAIPVCTRRRFLSVISTAAAGVPIAACRPVQVTRPAAAETPGHYSWSGIGFGIEMSMELHGVTRDQGERLGTQCEQSIQELEQAFSLYLENSELAILNRERILRKPSDVFRTLLAISISLQRRTLGYYQPAIHGAWEWLEKHGSSSNLKKNPGWNEQCAACDLKFLEIDPDGPIRLSNPHTRISMNAIAQGFLADTVAVRLRSAGVKSALLHLGESRAIGRHPEGRLWKLAIMGTPVNGATDLVGDVEFSDAGLAVSANDATRILIDPVSNTVRRQARVAAVVSREGAAVADAYATAFAAAPEQRWPDLARTLNKVPGSQVHIWVENERRFSQSQ